MRFLLIILVSIFILSQSAKAELSILVTEEQTVHNKILQLPHSDSYASLLTHGFSSSVFLLEESGGFSDVDPAKFSLHGDSWMHNEWHIDGINITDPLFSGSSAFTVPFQSLSHVGLRTRGAPNLRGNQGIFLRTQTSTTNRVKLSGDLGNMGGIVPFAIDIMDAISGLHILERGFTPPEKRRHQPNRFRAQSRNVFRFLEGTVTLVSDVKMGPRQFLEFSDKDSSFVETYREQTTAGSVGITFAPKEAKHKAYLFYEYQNRGHLFAENHFSRPETMNMASNALFLGYSNEYFQLGSTLKHYDLRSNKKGFTREIFDPDGEAIDPFFPEGEYLGMNLNLSADFDEFYVRSFDKMLFHTPQSKSWRNPLTFRAEDYGYIDWTSEASFSLAGQTQFGFQQQLLQDHVPLNVDVYLANQRVIHQHGDNSIHLLDVGIETGINFGVSEVKRWSATLSKSPLPVTSELARTTNPSYQNGQLFLNDGRLIDTFGGSNLSISPHLYTPNSYQASLAYSRKLSNFWTFRGQLLSRLYHGLYEIRFKDGPNSNGKMADGIYYLNEGQKQYELGNSQAGISAYWAGQFQFYGYDPERFLLNLAFTAYSSFSNPAFGNGPLSNDIGVVNFTTSNPNSEINRLAAVDSDRAFLFRLTYGAKIFEQLWGYLVISHRDGRPFSFYESHQNNGQVALTHKSRRGSPLKFLRPLAGPREDFRLHFDVSLQYKLQLSNLDLEASLVGRNLFDFGNEISERFTEPHNSERAGLEAEIPRSFSMNLALVY